MRLFARKALRAAAFIRHVPPQQIARRLWLEAKRRILAGRRSASALPSSQRLPFNEEAFEPLLFDRPRGIEVRPDGFVFTFLGRSLATGRKIDWRSESGPAADQLWRMNLHYMEYLGAVGDDVLADLIEQWIAGNRPYGPGYWRDAWNAYALSIRTTVWMEELARRRPRLGRDFVDRAANSLAEQLAFLAANLETDIGGNHLVKNLRALATGARFFAGARADAMGDLATRLLAEVLEAQVLGDGVHFERSPSYHNHVLGDLMAVRAALGHRLSEAQRVRLDAVVAAMAQAAADLTHPDGHVALFNDAGLNMGPSLRALADAYGRSCGGFPAARRHFAFPCAGYFGFRDARIYLVADCGRLGPDALMAHAHGDALSFELSVAGRRIIVDQGVYEYVAGEHREAARAAHWHNTLAISGLEQADFFGAFRCGVRPDVRVAEYKELPAGFHLEGWHDGFTRTGRGPVHRRGFELGGGNLLIHDSLEGSVPGQVTTQLLLHPGCDARESDGRVMVTCGAARVSISGSVPFKIVPAVHWPDMGIEQPTVRIVFAWPTGVREATTQIEIDDGSSSRGGGA